MGKTIGYRIKEIREKKGLTQQTLAELLGCAQTTVAGWEGKDQRLPSKHFLIKLTQVLNVTLDYLLNSQVAQTPSIPCYENIASKEFLWPDSPTGFLQVSSDEYSETKFALHIADSYMEPTIFKGDYCIFEKKKPKDRDIVVIRAKEKNTTFIRTCIQKGQNVVFLPPFNSLQECSSDIFSASFERFEGDTFVVPEFHLVVVGVLITLKRILK